MIGRLRGTLVGRGADGIVLEVAGVGYEVAVTPRGLDELPGIGDDAVVHTHLHGREDGISLYGFPTADERDLFRLLLGASGVGPKVAMAICATLTPAELRRAVVAEDAATLELVPGIGKRSAQKLIIELRPKMDLPDADLSRPAGPLAQVREALDALGYQPAEVKAALAALPVEGDVEDLVRQALKSMGSE